MSSIKNSVKPSTPVLQSTRVLDQLRERIRYRHYSLSTEQVYVYWVRFFIRWSDRGGVLRHPRSMGASEVEAFLTHLATMRKVSASTHNQALSAILFLYLEVLAIELPWLNGINRLTQKRRIPSVLTKNEVAGLRARMDGVTALIARLLYGTGMRLMEGMRLRIKNVDFDRQVIIVRNAKGGKDRGVMLPRSLLAALRLQLQAARAIWEADRQAQRGGVETPHALEQKHPKVGDSWAWFWMFPSPTFSIDPRGGVRSHGAPLVCHPSAAVGHRHPNSARTAGPFRRVHHHDLHPRAEGGSGRHGEPVGCSRPWALSDRFEVRGQRTALGRLQPLPSQL
jgi:integron integrase